MNDYTAEQRLAEVNKAIQAVLLGGQSYKLGSRSVTRADPVSYTQEPNQPCKT